MQKSENDLILQMAELKKEISNYLGIQQENLTFEYSGSTEKVRLDLITINSVHKQSFLFHTSYGFSKIDALYDMLTYVKSYKELDQSYTIQWSIKGSDELHTSYFRANNIFQALEKFSYGRDINGTVIFSVVLNPIS
jgi:hypothetical protein